ncbi:MAG: dsDNA-binding SOS-regulon protein [Colwellia sp.]|jgi:dsDNA-binding SOS-regulon protein
MAVESRFVVIRNGVEAKTFMDKKSADEYDKMLDMADNLSLMFSQSSVELTDSANEELSIFLAEHREDVLVALLAKKPTKISVDVSIVEVVVSDEPKLASKAKKSRVKAATTKLSEAS